LEIYYKNKTKFKNLKA